jgi:integrase
MNIPEMAAAYLSHCDRTYQSREPKNIQCAIARFACNVKALDKASIRHALDVLAREDLCSSYKHSTWRRWKAFLRWACEHDHISASLLYEIATFRPRLTGRTNQRSPVSFGVLVALGGLLDPWVFDFCRLLFFTGARPGELAGLRRSDIDCSSETWFATLHRHKNSTRGKSRTIAFAPRAQMIIAHHMHWFCPDDPIFPSPKDPTRCVSVQTVQQIIRRTLERHNLKHWTLYQIRHEAATLATLHTTPQHARALLGHASLQTTSIYTHSDRSQAAIAAKALEDAQ